MATTTMIRVRYAETDKMGIVHHSNYYVWFELGRSDFCREKGFSYLDMEDLDGVRLVVGESSCRYKSPAFYEDQIEVRTELLNIRSRSIEFGYSIIRPSDEAILATGRTLHIVTDLNNSIRTLPEKYRAMLS
ncbi:MAG: thioesterase family protein [Pyrinomonadaceae bacterium]